LAKQRYAKKLQITICDNIDKGNYTPPISISSKSIHIVDKVDFCKSLGQTMMFSYPTPLPIPERSKMFYIKMLKSEYYISPTHVITRNPHGTFLYQVQNNCYKEYSRGDYKFLTLVCSNSKTTLNVLSLMQSGDRCRLYKAKIPNDFDRFVFNKKLALLALSIDFYTIS